MEFPAPFSNIHNHFRQPAFGDACSTFNPCHVIAFTSASDLVPVRVDRFAAGRGGQFRRGRGMHLHSKSVSTSRRA